MNKFGSLVPSINYLFSYIRNTTFFPSSVPAPYLKSYFDSFPKNDRDVLYFPDSELLSFGYSSSF